ncbi:MAG: homoserine dehydrogenase [Gammaproteobacteria bacterium]|jgi:homoserine dehydrogenase|nr:homoserine dehydrogenase [Gammaproteobacteria bacterium]|tara:strand:+ start:2020 stop:3354 length:1335 start_codon:yes stop_codon:yes gene_type:complete
MLIYNLLCIGIDMINIGICGLGTVGQSSLEHIVKFKDEIRSNVSANFRISHVADLDIESKNLNGLDVITTNNAMDLAKNPDISIIIELIGGTTVAYEVVSESIKNKKHVITANKALIAEHGDKIFKLAKEANIFFGFEASVAGAIPIIKALTHNMLNEKIFSIFGIINGTCNYILDQMATKNLDFKTALAEAQSLGYAEADPSFDIGGNDAAHKISILASLIYKIPLPYKKTYIEGIESISSMDIKYSDELGYTIKHIGVTKENNDLVECRVHPMLVPKDNILSQVHNVMNAVLVSGERFGSSMFYGHGAGGDATASAVIANLVEAINFDQNIDRTNLKISESIGTKNKKIKEIDDIENSFYIKIHAKDVTGVMAEITNILAKENINIEAVTQHEPNESGSLIPIVMITDSVLGSSINKAIKKIKCLDNVKGEINSIRVLKLHG